VILQRMKRVAVEISVANNDTVGTDECHAMTEGFPSRIREGVGRIPGVPLRRHKPRFARELLSRLLGDPLVQALVDDRDHRNHEDSDDGKRIEEDSVR
jgi:hypothetical protein